jgi:hypothetical protein
MGSAAHLGVCPVDAVIRVYAAARVANARITKKNRYFFKALSDSKKV